MEYLLFLTMIIDGKDPDDEYNMYNIINQSTENSNDANFVYSGIDLEECIDDSKDIVEDLQIMNDPTTTDYSDVDNDILNDVKSFELEDDEELQKENELEEINSTIDKEWLKGIGLID